jgi:TolB protein
VAVALLASLVLVAMLAEEERTGSPKKRHDVAQDGSGRRPASRHPHRRAGNPRDGGGSLARSPAAAAPGGGGDEGEQEWSVYVAATERGRPRLAVSTPSEVPVTPAWSSATGEIAFARPACEDCDAAVWTTHPDGGGRRKVSARLGDLTDPTWSPTGRALAVVRVGGGLFAVYARHGGSRPLLGGAVVEDPTWSPRGDAIAFARRRGVASWDLYTIRPSGRGLRRLTRSPAQELAPAWSPDGRRIAFQRQERSGAWSVYVMRADGSGAHRLIAGTSAHNTEQPSWSPDGRSIAFVGVTLRGSRIEILRLGAGRAPRRLTGPGLEAADPDWSPSGGRIVFSAKRVAE